MPINATQREQTLAAQRELVAKVQLEQKFTLELRRLFRSMSFDLRNNIIENGGSISAFSYNPALRAILDRNYKRSQRKFTGEISKFLRDNIRNTDDPIIADLIAIAKQDGSTLRKEIVKFKARIREELNGAREQSVNDAVEVISRTTQKQIDSAISSTNTALTSDLGRPPTRRELGKATAKNFNNLQRSRSAMISATQTQLATEQTKQIERDNYAKMRNNATSASLNLEDQEVVERWVSQGDSLVRDGSSTVFNHLAADGQIKKNGVFVVSNQLLRFPGDRSQGATNGNVIRCRCSNITSIQ